MIKTALLTVLLLSVPCFSQEKSKPAQETIPADSVKPMYESGHPMCPVDDYRVKWFVVDSWTGTVNSASGSVNSASGFVFTAPESKTFTYAPNYTTEKVFSARCVKMTPEEVKAEEEKQNKALEELQKLLTGCTQNDDSSKTNYRL